MEELNHKWIWEGENAECEDCALVSVPVIPFVPGLRAYYEFGVKTPRLDMPYCIPIKTV